VASPTTTSYTNTGLTNGTTYSYQVSAVDTHGNESPLSSSVTATPQAPADTTAPSTPTGLAATAGNAQVALRWNASTDPDDAVASYNVYRNGVKVASPTTTSYTNTGLTNGTTYSYQVSAVDSHSNESALSSAVSATPTPPPPPTNPHILVIMMENHSVGAIIGNSQAPFENSLATSNISLTNWFNIDHPSAPNYIAWASGFDNGLTGAGDCSPGGSCSYTGDSLGTQLFNAGIPMSWNAEGDSGSGCQIVGDDVNHDPWSYMTQWQATPGACAEVHGTTAPLDPEMISQMNSANPPAFFWLTPTLVDDTHGDNGNGVATGDNFLRNLVAEVQGTSWYAAGGTIVITWDEDEGSSPPEGGANPPGYSTNTSADVVGDTEGIATFIISAKDANVGLVSTPGNHYGMLRSIEECYGLPLLNNAANAANGDIKSRLC
jgi:chitodextrinase